MKVSIMCDMKDSFLHEHIPKIISDISKIGHNISFIKSHKRITNGDILFLLGCSTIVSNKELSKNKHNIVIHPSKLPEGRGSAALIWKILEGENTGWITMFEANEKIDEGDIYFQEKISFEGHELSDEIREKQAKKIHELILKFIKNYPKIIAKKQKGKSSFYPKRTPNDSELDINKTLREQFNLLRVVDNKRYPAFFNYKNHKYIIKIFKEKGSKK